MLSRMCAIRNCRIVTDFKYLRLSSFEYVFHLDGFSIPSDLVCHFRVEGCGSGSGVLLRLSPFSVFLLSTIKGLNLIGLLQKGHLDAKSSARLNSEGSGAIGLFYPRIGEI
jgi:hypothetical protein